MFSTVEQAGTTTVSLDQTGSAPPAGFSVGNPAQYYDVATTATFVGEILVCIRYTDEAFTNTPSIFHFENGVWVDRTVQVNQTDRIVCGSAPSLSPFALFERVVYTTAAQPPINADGTSVFSRRGAIPIKFTLSPNGTTTCQLPVASLVLVRVSGESTTVVNESEYLFASDTGSVFRIAGCQYHYTLNAKTLGAGSYRAEVRIGGSAVGAAVFGLAR